MVAWRASLWTMSLEHTTAHSLLLKMMHQAASEPWWITVVYGPQGDQEKLLFVQELCAI
jgi:hypothetical protein